MHFKFPVFLVPLADLFSNGLARAAGEVHVKV